MMGPRVTINMPALPHQDHPKDKYQIKKKKNNNTEWFDVKKLSSAASVGATQFPHAKPNKREFRVTQTGEKKNK